MYDRDVGPETTSEPALAGFRVPIRPHFGILGVAPAEAESVRSGPPSHFGGNIDDWRIGKGATMFYPVQVPGALMAAGDPHAAQGDSELSGTAIEMSLTGVVQVVLHKEADTDDTILARPRLPAPRNFGRVHCPRLLLRKARPAAEPRGRDPKG
jgi:acetamidase/formamidase